MTLRQLQQQIGQIQATAARLARRLELTDRIAEIPLHPDRVEARAKAATFRLMLSGLYTRLHHLEARLPTPDTLGQREYNRLLALGWELEAAEAGRSQAMRTAHASTYRLAA